MLLPQLQRLRLHVCDYSANSMAGLLSLRGSLMRLDIDNAASPKAFQCWHGCSICTTKPTIADSARMVRPPWST